MPRHKKDETPLLAKVVSIITSDDYGEARAREFVSTLRSFVEQKWPPQVPVAAKVKQQRKPRQSRGVSSAPAAPVTNAQEALPYIPTAGEITG